MKIYTRFYQLLFSLFVWVSSYAAEQDNWYLAWEVDLKTQDPYQKSFGVAYSEIEASGDKRIYCIPSTNRNIKFAEVYDLNGTFISEFTFSGLSYQPNDLVVDSEGRLYTADRYWIALYNNSGETIWRRSKEDFAVSGIAVSEDNEIYLVDNINSQIHIFDSNGTFLRKFGEIGDAPGQLNGPCDLAFFSDGKLAVIDSQFVSIYFNDGTFIRRIETKGYSSERSGFSPISIGVDDNLFTTRHLRSPYGDIISVIPEIYFNESGNVYSRTCFSPEGDIVESLNNGKLRLWKRAFRTKGLPERNIIAQPAIRSVSQRAGTNIIDIDVEIIDADDSNVTLGVLAAIDGEFDNPNKWIIPQAWVDYSEEKIGTPISTNVVHTFSWDVKQDWAEPTGSLQFEVFAQTGSRTKPIDVHYLTLPLNDGNLTISRSPIKDPEMVNYFKYLLTTGQSGIALQGGNIVDGNGVALVEVSANTLQVTAEGRALFIDALGHRWAKLLEVSMAKEAATPGTVNQWAASRQVKPRNLPGQVNEYGFDVSSDHGSRAWWVVKNSTLPVRDFNSTIFDNNGSEDEYFGRMVAVDGNLVAVRGDTGSYNGRADQKKIYIYEVSAESNALTLKFILQPDDVSSSTSDGFGKSFALRNGQLLVGAHMADIPGAGNTNAGAAYLFDVSASSPTQVARFMSSDLYNDDYFGTSADLDSNLMVVGAYADDINGYRNSGSAYVFRRESNGTITELAKLTAPDGRADDYFGLAVAVDGNHIAIAASNADVERDGSLQSNAGKVYLYKLVDENPSYVETLTFDYPNSNNYFGASVGISNGVLAVGSYSNEFKPDGSHFGYTDSGSVSLYRLSENILARSTAFLKSPVPVSQGYFGYSLDLQGDRLVVGAYQEDAEAANDTGAAYLFEISEDGKPTLVERFTHPGGKPSDRFGYSVGVSGRNIVVGGDSFDLPNERWNAGQAIFYRESE